MKIAISTIIDNSNYGNRLQNYALEKALDKLGLNVTTVYWMHKDKNNIKLNILKQLSKLPINHKKIIIGKKILRFEEFTKNNINNTKKITDINKLKILNDEYDFFITGSDQVWNYSYRSDIGVYFLEHVDKHKRIAYAPSFGVSEIPKELENKYINWINGIEQLSVREEAGAKIINKLTGRTADVLIDPTMLLSKDEWLKLAREPKYKLKKKYVLTYVLGKKTKEFESFINSLTASRDIEVINILDFNKKDLYTCDPAEFIYLINNAEVVVTDSFHGAVFSIIMKTPFVIFERKDNHISMNSRIENLVATFKMQDRLSSNIHSIDAIYEVNFDDAHKILDCEKCKAINYLKIALNLEEERNKLI